MFKLLYTSSSILIKLRALYSWLSLLFDICSHLTQYAKLLAHFTKEKWRESHKIIWLQSFYFNSGQSDPKAYALGDTQPQRPLPCFFPAIKPFYVPTA